MPKFRLQHVILKKSVVPVGPRATCRRLMHNNTIILVHSKMQGACVGIIGNLGRMHTSVFSLAVFRAHPVLQSGNITASDWQ